MKIQWYVVYFKSGNEKKVADTLTRKKIESYFPVSKIIENWSIDKKFIDEPLFNNYIFVRTNEKQLVAVKKLPSVISLVYWLGKPVIISDAEINSIKRFLTDNVNIKIEKITLGGGTVKKINSAVLEKENLFKVNQSIDIVLPSLGYKLSAGVETSNVRIISPDNLIHKSSPAISKVFDAAHNLNNS